MEPSSHPDVVFNGTPSVGSLDERLIREGVGARNLARARLYRAYGAVFDGRRQGATITARCEGSGDERYRVRARLDAQGVAEASCTCPVGEAGACKHTGAVLLAWRSAPDAFVATASLDESLASMGRDELLELARAMIARRPELAALAESLLPRPLDVGRPPTARDAWRERASEIFREHLGEPEAGGVIARALEALVRDAEAHTSSDELGPRASAYEQVALSVVGRWRRLGADAAPALSVARACLDALAGCLARASDPTLCVSLLDALMGFYRFDVEQGTATHHALTPGRHALALAVREATWAELRALALRVREESDGADAWTRRAWSLALLEIEEGLIDDEAWVAQARELQRFGRAAQHLARGGRLDEALDEARRAHDAELLDVADALAARGLAAEAEGLVSSRVERASEANRARMSSWLRERAEARRDAQAVLDAMEAELRAGVELERYEALRTRAGELGLWEATERRVHAWLEERGHPMLLDVLLRGGRHDEALRVALGDGFKPTAALAQRKQLAEALERHRPRDARELYRRVVDGLVAMRSRAQYREACRVISRALELDARVGDGAGARWLASLRERYASLPAFQQELAARGGAEAAAA